MDNTEYHVKLWLIKFIFSKKAIKNLKNPHCLFDIKYVVSVKSTLKISSILVAFLENMSFLKKVYNILIIINLYPYLTRFFVFFTGSSSRSPWFG